MLTDPIVSDCVGNSLATDSSVPGSLVWSHSWAVCFSHRPLRLLTFSVGSSFLRMRRSLLLALQDFARTPSVPTYGFDLSLVTLGNLICSQVIVFSSFRFTRSGGRRHHRELHQFGTISPTGLTPGREPSRYRVSVTCDSTGESQMMFMGSIANELRQVSRRFVPLRATTRCTGAMIVFNGTDIQRTRVHSVAGSEDSG